MAKGKKPTETDIRLAQAAQAGYDALTHIGEGLHGPKKDAIAEGLERGLAAMAHTGEGLQGPKKDALAEGMEKGLDAMARIGEGLQDKPLMSGIMGTKHQKTAENKTDHSEHKGGARPSHGHKPTKPGA
jgi:hypothetical protein